MKSRIALSKNIRILRVRAGLSQEALAFAANVDRTYVSGIERGIRNPTIDILDDLAAALGVETVQLIQQIPENLQVLRLKSGRKKTV